MSDDRIRARLEEQGYDVPETNYTLTVAGLDEVSVDYLLERNRQRYVAMVRRAKRPGIFIKTGLPRAFMTLEAVRREGGDFIGDAEPLIILDTDSFDEGQYERVHLQMEKFAPDYRLIVLLGEEQEVIIDEVTGEHHLPEAETPASRQDVDLSFTDLDLWLTKFLHYKDDPPSESWKGVSVQNPNQLADRAKISIDKAYSFSNALKDLGYLRSESPVQFELVNMDSFLEKWREHYSWDDNNLEAGYCLPVEEGTLLERVIAWLGDLPSEDRKNFVLTRDLAAAMANDSHEVRPPGDIFNLGYAVDGGFDLRKPEKDEAPDIRVWEPKFYNAVDKAALEIEGVRVADPLQRSLDS